MALQMASACTSGALWRLQQRRRDTRLYSSKKKKEYGTGRQLLGLGSGNGGGPAADQQQPALPAREPPEGPRLLDYLQMGEALGESADVVQRRLAARRLDVAVDEESEAYLANLEGWSEEEAYRLLDAAAGRAAQTQTLRRNQDRAGLGLGVPRPEAAAALATAQETARQQADVERARQARLAQKPLHPAAAQAPAQVQAASQQPVELAAKPAGRETQHPAAQQQQPPPPVALTAKPAGAAPSAAQGAAPQPPAPPEPLPAPERPHTPSPEAVERASEPTVRPPPPKKPPRKPWQRTPWDSDSDEELLAPVRQQPAPPGPAAPPAEAAPAARRMEIRKLEQQAGKAGAPWHDEHGQQHREVTPEQRQKTRELNRQIALAGQASNRTFDVKVWKVNGAGVFVGGRRPSEGVAGFIPLTHLSGHHAQMVLSEEARLLAVLEKEEAPAAQEVVAGAAARQQQGLRKLAMGVLLGQAITVRVLKVPEDPANQRILLSERLALAADGAPQLLAAPQLAAAAAMADAAAVVDCLVLRVADFGVVVEFNLPDGEAIVGLLPPNQVSWEDATPAGAPAVKPGQVVRAAVMRVSRSKARVFLSARHAFAQGVLDALDAGADERPELGPALPEAARFCAAIQEARGVVEATPGARARTPGVAQQLELYFKLGRLAPEPRGERGGAAGDGAPARDGQRAFASNLATHVLLLRAGRSAQVVAVTTTLHREEFKRLALDVVRRLPAPVTPTAA